MANKKQTIDEQIRENSKSQLNAAQMIKDAEMNIELIKEDQKTFFSRVLMFLGLKKDALPAAEAHLELKKSELKTIKEQGEELNTIRNAAKAIVEDTSALASKISSTLSKGIDWVNKTTGITSQNKQLEEITEKLRENVTKKSSPPPLEQESSFSRFLSSVSMKSTKGSKVAPDEPAVKQEERSGYTR